MKHVAESVFMKTKNKFSWKSQLGLVSLATDTIDQIGFQPKLPCENLHDDAGFLVFDGTEDYSLGFFEHVYCRIENQELRIENQDFSIKYKVSSIEYISTGIKYKYQVSGVKCQVSDVKY